MSSGLSLGSLLSDTLFLLLPVRLLFLLELADCCPQHCRQLPDVSHSVRLPLAHDKFRAHVTVVYEARLLLPAVTPGALFPKLRTVFLLSPQRMPLVHQTATLAHPVLNHLQLLDRRGLAEVQVSRKLCAQAADHLGGMSLPLGTHCSSCCSGRNRCRSVTFGLVLQLVLLSQVLPLACRDCGDNRRLNPSDGLVANPGAVEG